MNKSIVALLAFIVVTPALGKDNWYPVFGDGRESSYRDLQNRAASD